MKIKRLEDLVTSVKSFDTKSKVAVIMAQDEHTLDAVTEAVKNQVIDAVLIGKKEEIQKILEKLNANPEDYEIEDISEMEDCIAAAIKMVNSGKVNILMKGKMETGQIMRAILDKNNNLRKGGTLSLVALYETKAYHKLFAVTDVAINTYPDFNGKRAILENGVSALHAIGIENPKVGVLAAVEKANPKMPETMDAAKLKELNQTGEIKGCIVEGPISFDLATDPDAGIIKGYESPVAGDVDLLVVHELTTGNALVKCLTGMAGATTCGIVVGARVPIILTSRSAEASDKYYSIAFAAFAAKAMDGREK